MKVRVVVAGTIGKSVLIDTNPRATLENNVYLPSGDVANANNLRTYLGIGTNSTLRHSDLQGLKQGDDHPQYPLWNGRETINGQWDFTKQLWAAAGSAVAPSYSWTLATGNGMYLVDSTTIGFATEGVLRATINASGNFISTLSIRGPDGSASAPTYSFASDTNLGTYRVGADDWGIATAGTLRWDVSTTAITSALVNLGVAGSAGAPAWSHSGDPDTGAYSIGANRYGIATGGTLRLEINAQGNAIFTGVETTSEESIRISTPSPILIFYDTDAAADNHVWRIRANASDFRVSCHSDDFSAQGVGFLISRTGAVITNIQFSNETDNAPLRIPGGSAGTPALARINDTDTGFFWPGANQLGIAAAGGEVARFDANATAAETRFMVYDVDNATLERVSVGAADSGGTGFKVLRIPN